MLSDIYTPVKHNNAPIISQRPLTAVRPPPICGGDVSVCGTLCTDGHCPYTDQIGCVLLRRRRSP